MDCSINNNNILLIAIKQFSSSKREFLFSNYPPKLSPYNTFSETFDIFYYEILIFGLEDTFATVTYFDDKTSILKIINKDTTVAASRRITIDLNDEIKASYILI